MPKLPVLSPEKLAKALEKKGFELDRIRGRHNTRRTIGSAVEIAATMPLF